MNQEDRDFLDAVYRELAPSPEEVRRREVDKIVKGLPFADPPLPELQYVDTKGCLAPQAVDRIMSILHQSKNDLMFAMSDRWGFDLVLHVFSPSTYPGTQPEQIFVLPAYKFSGPSGDKWNMDRQWEMFEPLYCSDRNKELLTFHGFKHVQKGRFEY